MVICFWNSASLLRFSTSDDSIFFVFGISLYVLSIGLLIGLLIGLPVVGFAEFMFGTLENKIKSIYWKYILEVYIKIILVHIISSYYIIGIDPPEQIPDDGFVIKFITGGSK